MGKETEVPEAINLRIVKGHQLEERIFVRRIRETFCADPNCQFNGKYAAQGICFSNEGQLVDFAKLDAKEKEILEELAAIRTKCKDDADYIHALEAYFMTAQLNWDYTIDDSINLRRKNRLLEAKIEAMEKAGVANQ